MTRFALETMQASLKRVTDRIDKKKQELKELDDEKKQVEQLIGSLTKK
jgi:predicted  nucleic acid-binding Zn-ribbon protein